MSICCLMLLFIRYGIIEFLDRYGLLSYVFHSIRLWPDLNLILCPTNCDLKINYISGSSIRHRDESKTVLRHAVNWYRLENAHGFLGQKNRNAPDLRMNIKIQ